jgi:hypothetical protein
MSETSSILILTLATVTLSFYTISIMRWWGNVRMKFYNWARKNYIRASIVVLFNLALIPLMLIVPLVLLGALSDYFHLGRNAANFALLGWISPVGVYLLIYLFRSSKQESRQFAEKVKNAAPVDTTAISEFKLRLKAYQRILGFSIIAQVALFLSAFAVIFVVSKRIYHIASFDVISIVIICISIPVIAILWVYAAVWPERRLPSLGLICPKCGKPLIGGSGLFERTVIATGRCTSCGSQVLKGN